MIRDTISICHLAKGSAVGQAAFLQPGDLALEAVMKHRGILNCRQLSARLLDSPFFQPDDIVILIELGCISHGIRAASFEPVLAKLDECTKALRRIVAVGRQRAVKGAELRALVIEGICDLADDNVLKEQQGLHRWRGG
ncbi:MAG TPA: hypothetical protein VL282_00225 [Tepidisphaeraceae bacterium]|nr:hypothetical protein [Tepidisphaeraceae bacterium]